MYRTPISSTVSTQSSMEDNLCTVISFLEVLSKKCPEDYQKYLMEVYKDFKNRSKIIRGMAEYIAIEIEEETKSHWDNIKRLHKKLLQGKFIYPHSVLEELQRSFLEVLKKQKELYEDLATQRSDNIAYLVKDMQNEMEVIDKRTRHSAHLPMVYTCRELVEREKQRGYTVPDVICEMSLDFLKVNIMVALIASLLYILFVYHSDIFTA